MSRRRVERAALYACAACAALTLAACAPAARAGGGTPLPLHSVVDVPLDGQSRRFASQRLDGATGTLFIADFDGGRVVVFDTQTDRVVKVIRDLPTAQEILAVPELHRVYVSEPGTYEVAAIDTRTYDVVARMPGGRYPAGMAWDPVHRRLYVSDVIGETETVIDTTSNARIATIPLGGAAGGSQFAPSENLVYVNVRTTRELVAIDPASDAVVARYPIAGCADNTDLLVDDVHRLAYIACRGSARLVTFDLRSHRMREAVAISAGPSALAWDAAASLLYVASERGTISMFSTAGGRLRKTAEGALADDAHSVAVDAATHRLYFPLHDAAGRPVLRVMLFAMRR
jgi:YVTN family beta-propeller protein